MADSISILKGSLKAGIVERPVLQIYKSISDYFERSLKERLNDYNTANIGQLSDDYSDNSLNNQAVSHYASNYNYVESSEYNSSYAKKYDSYYDEHNANNGSDSDVLARDTAVQKSSDNAVSSKNETKKNDGSETEKTGELTANNNHKTKSEQAEGKAENKSDTQQKTIVPGENEVKTKSEAKSLAEKLQLVKDGKSNITNLIIGKKTDDISIQKNVKLNENVKLATDANIIKTNNVNTKSEMVNIKINPGFAAQSSEILQEVKQGDKSIKLNEQGVLNNKEISGLFMKQNEVVSKNQTMNELNNLKPGLTNIEQRKIAENLNPKANNSENALLPKDDKTQQTAAKYVTDNNTQASQNLSKTGIAEKVYNTPKIAGKEIDFTNSVGMRRVKLEEIAEKTLQLAKNIQSNTTQTARLYLKPPSLGTVYVEISMKDNLAKIVMKADTREVVKNLENQLIYLQEKLNQQGIKTESIKIEIRQVENDITDRHAFFEGSNARQKNGKADREFIGTLHQLSEEDLVTTDEVNDDGILINTNFL